MDVRLAGQIDGWPSKSEMATLLSTAGLNIRVGTYSIRITDCQHFAIQEYGGVLGDPVFDADADSLLRMLADTSKVSTRIDCSIIYVIDLNSMATTTNWLDTSTQMAATTGV